MPTSRTLVLALLALSGPAAAQMTFTEVSAERGLVLELAEPSPGSAIGDIDGDGWLDIVIFGAADPRPHVYRNNGALASSGADPRWFHDVTRWVIPEDASPASAGQLIDLDDDGDQDMLVTRRYYEPLKGEPDAYDTGIEFYENRNGRFVANTCQPFMGRAPRRHGGSTFADTDLDGDLDLVFVHNGSFDTLNGGPGFYFRNDGFPRFVDSTDQFGANIGDDNRYFTAVLADFNMDMLPDLHVAVDFYSDFHCWNMGGGIFQDVSQMVGTTNLGADMGLAVGDIENDGDLDMYSTNINVGVLYVNDGTGHFVNDASNRGVSNWGFDTVIGWGTVFADFDLDRDQDLAFVCYGTGYGRLYENDGTGHFTNATNGSNLILRGHGLMAFDYDHDGDEDLFVCRSNGLALYENRANDQGTKHWLSVEVEGTKSNRPGIGTRIQVETPDGTVQTKHVISGASYLTGPTLVQHFGLGDTDQVKELRVTWPDGHVDVYGPLAGDQALQVKE